MTALDRDWREKGVLLFTGVVNIGSKNMHEAGS